MEPKKTWLPWHEMGRLHDGLATAPDDRIARVVAMVDALGERGIADDLIAPLRSRLAQLRPPRPLQFRRLLFMPLDPLIVAASEWQPGDITIPRTALVPIASLVHASMGDAALEIEAAILNHSTEATDEVLSAGSRLWPSAASILMMAEQSPDEWADAALPPDAFPVMTGNIAALLEQTDKLLTLFAEAEIGVSLQVERFTSLVAPIAARSTDTLAMMAVLVLARLPETQKLLRHAASGLGRDRDALMDTAIERAEAVLLKRLETGHGIEALVIGSTLDQAAAAVRRVAQLLSTTQGRKSDAAWRARAIDIAQRLDRCCRLRVATALEVEFADALRNLGAQPGPNAFTQLEAAARGLHDLQQEARRVGNSTSDDALLRQAAAMVTTMPDDASLSLIDRVRLVEILIGPDEALALLDPADTDAA